MNSTTKTIWKRLTAWTLAVLMMVPYGFETVVHAASDALRTVELVVTTGEILAAVEKWQGEEAAGQLSAGEGETLISRSSSMLSDMEMEEYTVEKEAPEKTIYDEEGTVVDVVPEEEEAVQETYGLDPELISFVENSLKLPFEGDNSVIMRREFLASLEGKWLVKLFDFEDTGTTDCQAIVVLDPDTYELQVLFVNSGAGSRSFVLKVLDGRGNPLEVNEIDAMIQKATKKTLTPEELDKYLNDSDVAVEILSISAKEVITEIPGQGKEEGIPSVSGAAGGSGSGTPEAPADDASTDEQSTDDSSDEQSADDSSDEQSTDDSSDEQSADDSSDEQSTDDSSDEQSADDSSDEQSTDDSSDEQSADDSSDEQSTDDSSDEQSTDDSSDEQSTDDSSDEQSTDDSSDEQSTDDSSDEQSTDDSSDDSSVSEISATGKASVSNLMATKAPKADKMYVSYTVPAMSLHMGRPVVLMIGGDSDSGSDNGGDESSDDDGDSDSSSDDGQSGDEQSDDGQSGDEQSDDGQSGDEQSDDGQSGDEQSDDGQSDDAQSDSGSSGGGASGGSQTIDEEDPETEPEFSVTEVIESIEAVLMESSSASGSGSATAPKYSAEGRSFMVVTFGLPLGASNASFSVEFIADGSRYAITQVSAGELCPAPATPVPSDYGYRIFLGWTEDPSAQNITYFDFDSTPVNGPLTLTAVFSDGYIIQYKDAPDGAVVDTIMVESNAIVPATSAVITPPNGYHIAYWYVEGSQKDPTSGMYPHFAFGEERADADITLVPYFSNRYYVIFISAGTQVPAQEVESGGRITQPTPNPTRTGYTFRHWSTTKDGNTAYNFNTAVSDNTTLYAVWTPRTDVKYTIAIWLEKPNMGTDFVPTPGDISHYNFVTSVEATGTAGNMTNINTTRPASINNLFNGTAAASVPGAALLKYGAFQTAHDKVILGNGTTVVNLYATRKVYTYYFNLTLSSGSPPSGAEMRILKPGLTTWGGPETYDAYTPSSVQAQQYSFKAKYEQEIFDLFPVMGMSNVKFYPQTPTAYVVQSWARDTNMLGTANFASRREKLDNNFISSNGQILTYTLRAAQWTTITSPYNYRYFAEALPGQTGPSITYTRGSDTRTYIIMSQFSQEHISALSAKAIVGMTAYENNVNLGNSGTYHYEYFEILDSNKKPTGEYVPNKPAGTEGTNFLTCRVFLYHRDRFSLTFNMLAGGDTVTNTPSNASIMFDEPLTAYAPSATPLRSGYVFAGWYKDADYKEAFNFSLSAPNSDTTVYAKWESNANTVYFYDGIKTKVVVDQQGVATGANALPSAYFDNPANWGERGEFAGWQWYVGGLLFDFDFEIPITGDTHLYAKWKTSGFKVTYNRGIGTGMPPVDTNEYYVGASARVLNGADLIPPSGQVFVGWRKEGDTTGSVYYPGNLLPIGGHVTLVAAYGSENDVYSVTFNAGTGGSFSGQKRVFYVFRTPEVAWGDVITVPTPYANTGYYFDAWGPAIPSKDTLITRNWEITANFRQKGNWTVTGGSSAVSYSGQTVSVTSHSASGLPAGYTYSGVTASGSGKDAGAYPVNVALGDWKVSDGSGNDVTAQFNSPSTTSGTLTIDRVTLTVTVAPKTVTYGDPVPTLTRTITGFVNSETESVITVGPLSTTYTQGNPVGVYPITSPAGTATNYIVPQATGQLTVNQMGYDLSALKVKDDTKVYGQTLLTNYGLEGDSGLIALVESLYNVAYERSSNSLNVGTYTVTAKLTLKSGANDSNYDFINKDKIRSGELKITPKTLTVTVDNKNISFNDPVPPLTRTITGFEYSEGESVITVGALTTTYTQGDQVGMYTITSPAGTAQNYIVPEATGALTVGSLSIDFSKLYVADAAKVYGDADPTFEVLSTEAGYLEFVKQYFDIPAPTRATGENVTGSPYTISAAAPTLKPVYSSSDFTISGSIADGKFTITKANLSITAQNVEIAFGDPKPTFFVLNYSGFKFSDDETTAFTTLPVADATTYAPGSPNGSYEIILTTQGVAPNYNLNYTKGYLDVGVRTVDLSKLYVKSDTKVYGDAGPNFNNCWDWIDSNDAVLLALVKEYYTFTVSTSPNQNVGTYPITADSPVLKNAANAGQFNLIGDISDGKLEITKRTLVPVVYTGPNWTIDYYAEVPDLSYSTGYYYTNFAFSDGLHSLDTPGVISTTYYKGAPANTYPVTLTEGLDNNYIVPGGSGTITVNAISINFGNLFVADKEKTYGDLDPAFELKATTGNEAMLALVQQHYDISFIRAPGETVPLSPYTISAILTLKSQYVAGGFSETGSITSGKLTIKKAQLRIAAKDENIAFNDPAPPFTLVCDSTDFKFSDKLKFDADPTEIFDVIPFLSTTYNPGDSKGTYPIVVSGGSAYNYELVRTNGTLNVGVLGINFDKLYVKDNTADNTKVYGDADPTFEVLSTEAGYLDYVKQYFDIPTPTRVPGEDVGVYDITATATLKAGLDINDFSIQGDLNGNSVNIQKGTLTITKRAVTITVENKEKFVGENDPQFTFIPTNFVGAVAGANPVLGTNFTMTRVAGEVPGTYKITGNFTPNPNYNVTITDGNLTIKPRNNTNQITVTVTAKSETYLYDSIQKTIASDTFDTLSLTGSADMTVGNVTATASGAQRTDVGETPNTVTGVTVTFNGVNITNYVTVVKTDGKLTITPFEVDFSSYTVKVDDKIITYGDAEPTYTLTGWPPAIAGIDFSQFNAPVFTRADSGNKNVGTYAISAAITPNTGNYVIKNLTIAPGTLTINRKALLIKADDKAAMYSDPTPEFTATYTGFITGESSSVLSTQPQFSCPYQQGDWMGTYTITASGAAAQNYTITYQTGTLTVTHKLLDLSELGVKPADREKVYDMDPSTDPALEIENWPAGVDISLFTVNKLEREKSGDPVNGQQAGDYTITLEIESNVPQYEVVKQPGSGTFTILRKVLTYQAHDATKVRKEADPVFSATLLDQLASNMDVPVYSVTRTPGEFTGSYPIMVVASQAENPNYDFVSLNGTFRITPVTGPRPTTGGGGDRDSNDYGGGWPGGGGTVTIDDDNVPLASMPDSRFTVINDTEVPLTGGIPAETGGVLGALLLGIGALLKRKRKDEDNAEA